MPLIHINPLRDVPGGTASTTVDISAQVYRNGKPAIRVSSDDVYIPQRIATRLSGTGSINLDIIPVDCYWRVTLLTRIDYLRLDVQLPGGAGPFDFDELIKIDPTTGLPDPGTTPADALIAVLQGEADSAIAAREGAETAETAAQGSATAAAGYLSSVAGNATAAGISATNAHTSEVNAANSVTTAGQYKDAAGISETNAHTSEVNAATSASNAMGSQGAAAGSATNSANSATDSASSATDAASSAAASLNSQGEAHGSETNAAASAASALDSENAAAQSASAAGGSEATVMASANAAASSATAAHGSEVAAATSASNASISETSAAGYENATEANALSVQDALTAATILLNQALLDLSSKQDLSAKGQANGYAGLDSGGKVPFSQLPSTLLDYQGTWNASTNIPHLVDGTGKAGDTYKVAVDGTQNLGSGSVSYNSGDLVLYNGTVWQKVDTTDQVNSVNGHQGVVVLVKGDVGLDQVDNTSDANKPISSATQTALNANITGMSISGRNLMATTLGGTTLSIGTIVTNFTLGTVTTGAAGSSAAVSITGTAPDLTISFTIPQGAKGDIGDFAGSIIQSVSGALTISANSPQTRVWTLTGNITSITFPTPGATYSFSNTLVFKQDATGGRTVVWPVNVKWSEGLAPILPSAAGSISAYQFLWDGAEWLGFVGGRNFA